jgi:hypothetical protein
MSRNDRGIRVMIRQAQDSAGVQWSAKIQPESFFFNFLKFLLFICAYNVWVISPPFPLPARVLEKDSGMVISKVIPEACEAGR